MLNFLGSLIETSILFEKLSIVFKFTIVVPVLDIVVSQANVISFHSMILYTLVDIN